MRHWEEAWDLAKKIAARHGITSEQDIKTMADEIRDYGSTAYIRGTQNQREVERRRNSTQNSR